MPDGAPKPELVAGGSGWVEGKFRAPPGWPEGAGWRVVDPETGETVQWGPAEDFRLVATTSLNPQEPLPAPEDTGIALKGLPIPPDKE